VGEDNQNVFAGAFVDRSGELRKDADWLADALTSDDSRFVAVWNDKFLAGVETAGVVLLEGRELDHAAAEQELIFLGIFRDSPTFAIEIGGDDAPFQELGEFPAGRSESRRPCACIGSVARVAGLLWHLRVRCTSRCCR